MEKGWGKMAIGLKSLLWLLSLAFCAVASAATPAPNYRALLVGVSEYPNLQGKDLKGPKNDVAAMRDLLKARGFKPGNIRVLADGVAQSAALPTRGAIVKELQDLARTAKPNDYIVIMLGGHGAQLPVPAGHPAAAEEDDGLFEVFLPRDVQRWTGGTGAEAGDVQNYLPDHEFRALVDRVAATGAFVWVIVDACHSTTLVRSGAADPEVVYRQVTAADLGVPQEALQAASQRARPLAGQRQSAKVGTARAGASGAGRAVYFYSAQPHQLAPEVPLPSGHPERREHGLFTFTLMRALQGLSMPMSYEQLGRWVRTELAGSGFPEAVNPEYSGSQLRSQVLGTNTLAVAREWLLGHRGEQLVVPAGLAQDVGRGSILAILHSTSSPDAQAIGFARVEHARAFEATLVPVAYRSSPAVPMSRLREGKVARLMQPGTAQPLVVHADLSACAKPCLFDQAIKLLPAVVGTEGARTSLRWSSGPNGAQWVLKAEGHRLWILPPGQPLPQHPNREKRFSHLDIVGSSTPAGMAKTLAESLDKVARVTHLLRLAESLAKSGAGADLQITLYTAHMATGGSIQRSEGPALRSLGQRRVGELVEFELNNRSRFQMDVVAFYIDSQFGVCEVFPGNCDTPSGLSAQTLSGGGKQSFHVGFNDSSLGQERVVVIANQRQEKFYQPIDLSFLQQSAIRSGPVERGTAFADEPSTASIQVFGFDLTE